MAMEQETIVSLHKKGESKSAIAKELQIRREMVWKLVKKFKETGQTSNRPGQGRKRIVRTKRMVKTRGKSWGQIFVVRRPNWPQRLEPARLRCVTSLRRTSRPSPTRCRSAMSSHPRMNEWGSKDVDTFRTSWKMACCPIWCSLTRRNLTLSSVSTIKTTVFGVGMHPWKAGEGVDARIQPLLWFGRPSQPLEGLPLFSCPQEWNWTASFTSRTFWKVNYCHGPESTSREHLVPSSKTRRPHMVQEWPNSGSRPTSRRSSARKTGLQGARTWILWTFRWGSSLRAKPAEILMLLSRIWKPNCSRNGPWTPKKFCVPRAMPFKGDWSKLLKIKEAILNKW